jgi:hypothetical protein
MSTNLKKHKNLLEKMMINVIDQVNKQEEEETKYIPIDRIKNKILNLKTSKLYFFY